MMNFGGKKRYVCGVYEYVCVGGWWKKREKMRRVGVQYMGCHVYKLHYISCFRRVEIKQTYMRWKKIQERD